MACAGLVLALIGCGDVSDHRFRSQVNAICRSSAAQVSAIPAPPSSDLAANGRYTGQVVTVVSRARDKLKAVEAPSAKSSEYKKWVSTIEQMLGVIARQSAAAAGGDQPRFNELVQQQNTLLQESKAKAALLGLTECAK